MVGGDDHLGFFLGRGRVSGGGGENFLGLHLDGVAEGEVPFLRGKVQLVVVNGVRGCGEERMGSEERVVCEKG